MISAETWTWLHSPAFSATPLDMKAEADRMLLQGVNQFVGHGWPYTPPGTLEPGYAFYAAAVFNDHNPWWNVMPDVNGYLTRMSYLMRQGEPANDVAVFLPNDDVYAALVPGKVSLSAEMHKHVTPELTEQILDAGHNLDYVDAESVLALGIKHPVLVMPHVTRLAPEVHGQAGRLRARRRQDHRRRQQAIAGARLSSMPRASRAQVLAASQALFAIGADVQRCGGRCRRRRGAGPRLRRDLQLCDHAARHRLRQPQAGGCRYLLHRQHQQPRGARQRQRRRAARAAAWWNPDNGKITPRRAGAGAGAGAVRIARAGAERCAAGRLPSAPRWRRRPCWPTWAATGQLRFPARKPAQAMPQLRSWTDDAATRYFSGVASLHQGRS